ncbi:MAG: hypothetical protein ACRD4E_07265, partial [Bryobacteraceae bacterium]
SLVPIASGAAFTVTVGSATTGTLNFGVQGTDGTLTHSQPVSLTVGTDVGWLDTGSDTVAVEAGQSASYSFSASPVGGGTFSGTVSIACANLPALTSCSFSPPSIAAGAGTTAVTLTIATTGPYSAGSLPQRRRMPIKAGRTRVRSANVRGVLGVAMWSMAIPLAGIFLTGIRRGRTTRHAVALGFSVALIGLLLMVACGGIGGGGGGQPPPQVSVTVSPRSASIYADEPENTWTPEATEQVFTAVVNNGSSQNVTWAVTGGDTNGTIDPNGVYHSPSSAPTPASVTVTATSPEASQPGTATVTILAPTPVGTFPISVSATAAGGAAHTDVATLIVD